MAAVRGGGGVAVPEGRLTPAASTILRSRSLELAKWGRSIGGGDGATGLRGAQPESDLRDLVATGVTPETPEFGRHIRDYLAAAEEAQTTMRRDLGTSWNRPDRERGGAVRDVEPR